MIYRRARPYFMGCSITALAAFSATAASAGCSPYPTQALTTTTCTGVNSGGLSVDANGATLVLENGASVAGGSPAAITTTTGFSTVRVDGTLSGEVGILVQNGPRVFDNDPFAGAASPAGTFVFPFVYPQGSTSIIVGASGQISGNVAIRLAQGPNNGLGDVFATIDNSGTISSNAGAAIQVAGTDKAYLSFVVNRSTGRIGGIDAAITSLTNDGAIDGGSTSALAIRLSPPSLFNVGNGSVNNSGTIVSRSATATIASVNRFQFVSNSGLIGNDGEGAAISATESLSVINAAGGTIRAGATAIATSGSLALQNRGRIAGAVVVTGSAAAGGSQIDSTGGGVIEGGVSLGGGDDVILAELGSDGRFSTGILGAIDGGPGTNELRLNLAANTSFASAVTLPANFQRFAINLSEDAIVTLAPGFTAPAAIALSGAGQLVNDVPLSGNGSLIVGQGFSFNEGLRLLNKASIAATLSDPSTAAVKLPLVSEFENQGTISATGGNAVDLTGSGRNSRTIGASGAAVVLTGSFENAGTLTSSGSAAILLPGSAQVQNLVNGVISGNGVAIARPADSDVTTSVTIRNAGTINGDVNLAGSTGRLDYGSDVFTQLLGGRVNGNVLLGGGSDFFTAEFGGQSSAPTGVSGTINGGDGFDTLILRAVASSNIGLDSAINFERTGLEVEDNATLVVTGGSSADQMLSISGDGKIDLTVNLNRADGTAIDATAVPFSSTDLNVPPTSGNTDIVSRGSLLVTRGMPTFEQQAAVLLGAQDDFTNAGTITARDASASPFNLLAAVQGGDTIVNSGSILFDGANGVVGAAKIVNSGTIARTDGGTAGFGVLDVPTIVNSGTIGVIKQSTRGYLLVDNKAGGTIGEIQIAGASVGTPGTVQILNAGTIGSALVFQEGSGSNIFVNAGGRVAGDLRMADPNGFSSLTFVSRTDESGVDGLIDAGLGLDSYLESFSASGSYDLATMLPSSFEFGGVEALGSGTTVTLTSADDAIAREGISLLGNGSIVNKGNIVPVSREGSGIPGAVVIRSSAIAYLGMAGESKLETVPVFTGNGFSTTFISYGGALAAFTNDGTIDGDVRVATANFTNTGTIHLLSRDTGTVIRAAADADFGFTNSGTVTMENNGIRSTALSFDRLIAAVNIRGAIDSSMGKAVSVSNSGEIIGGLDVGSSAGTFAFANSGTIRGGTTSGSNGFITLEQYVNAVNLAIGSTPFALNELESNASTATINNSGLIDGGISADIAAIDMSLVNSGNILAPEGATEAINVHAFVHESDDGAAIDAERLSFANTGRIAGAARLYSEAKELMLSNTGEITSPNTEFGGLFFDITPAFGVGNDTDASNRLSFDNSGSISTAEYASPALLLLSEAGSSDNNGNIDLSLPPVEGGATATIMVTNSGSIAASGGDLLTPGTLFGQPGSTIIAPATGLALLADGVGATSIVVDNKQSGIINARGAPHIRTFEGGVQPVADSPASAGGIAIAASADTVTIRNDGQIIGGPAATFDPALMILSLPDGFSAAGVRGGAIDTANSQDLVVNGATGTVIGGIALRDGGDRLANYGSIDGDVYLGDGDDEFVQGIAAAFIGTADGGAGIDSALIDITAGGTIRNTTFDQFVGFEMMGITGSGAIQTEGALASESLLLRDGEFSIGLGTSLQTQSGTAIRGGDQSDERVVNRGTVNGGIALGAGADEVENHGLIDGQVSLGDGSDQFVFHNGSIVAGLIDAGAGNDRLRLNLGGTLFDFAPFQGFEQLEIDAGAGSFSGTVAFDIVDINAGRLTGLAGSTLSSQLVDVGAGATFGTAGTVNGDIHVAGTLAPGASPGTMTVNGDVALASGSITLFEMTPTVSDAIVINGALAIAGGSTLTLTGERPLTPGASYDLIVANEGITGSFTTVNKASTVLGFIRQAADRIQLLGQLQLQPGSSAQIGATVNYLNGLLIGGTATSGLIDAVPGLLSAAGFADSAKIGRLHPEPYASASQIGIENGLAIAATLRSVALPAGRDTPGLFGFGQGFGSWRRLPGSDAAGSARANVQTQGLLGGIGIGSETASIGAFVGHVDSRQRIGTLGARTDADGIVAGLIGRAHLGGLELGVLVARDGSSADTERSLVNSATARSHYRLRGWIGDLSAGYSIGVGPGWTLLPELSLTHISSRRGAASESGAGAFSLDIDGRRTNASFVGARLTLKGDEAAKVRPWFSAGLREQIGGQRSFATASLANVAARFTIPGVARNTRLATMSAGLSAAISAQAEVFAGFNSEFGADSSGESANLGLRLHF